MSKTDQDQGKMCRTITSSSSIHLLILIALGIIIYSNTFKVPFVLDDSRNIVENPFIKDWHIFSDALLAKDIASDRFQITRFIGYLSFALNYRLHGLDVVGYHITNLTIHIITTMLVYWLVLMTFESTYFSDADTKNTLTAHRKMIAFFSALLFVAHPIQTQAVTYVVQRFASLATMCYIASLVMYVKSRLISSTVDDAWPPSRVSCYALSLLFACLAMYSKEIAFTLPVIIVLYEFLFFEKSSGNRIVPLIPLLFTLLIIPISMMQLGGALEETMGEFESKFRLQTTMTRWDYLFTQFRVIVTYLRLLVFPVNQNLDYDYPVFHSFFSVEVFASFVLLATLLGIASWLLIRTRRGCLPALKIWRLIAFGILWFFLTLLVESSVIPIIDVIFEHRLYLPSIGICIAVSACIVHFAAIHPKSQWLIYLSMSIACLSLGSATFFRNQVWRNELSLWQDSLSKSPKKTRVLNNLGVALMRNKNYEAALHQFSVSLDINPSDSDVWTNAGIIYCSTGRYREAEKVLLQALALNPNNALAREYLALAYIFGGNVEKARVEIQNLEKVDSAAADRVRGYVQ